ncbi:unnamed protein product [Acanthosepion pharaonis]|uniref:Uncharacterized protein n=1 Tax=Acanthosepion pharaonis TaxID=158019 RepID=A0A812BIM7_ACAPH|nr:unnamed protein product [Sepia pharaonis]
MITSSDETSQSTPTQSTERVSLPKLNTILVQVPTSSPTTTRPTTDSQSQKTMKTTHWSLSSVAIENSTSLPTITRQSKNSTTKKLSTATNASTTHVLQISEVTTDTAEQNITATPVNESDLTPATQTDVQPQPNSENRISTGKGSISHQLDSVSPLSFSLPLLSLSFTLSPVSLTLTIPKPCSINVS